MIYSQIFSLFLIIFLGYLTKKVKITNDSWISILNNFAFYIAFPALVFVTLADSDLKSILQNNFLLLNFLTIIIFSFLVYLFCSLLKLPRGEKVFFTIGSIFGNVAYLGVPLGQITLGKNGEIDAVALSVVYLILILTLGIFLLESYSCSGKEKNIRGILKNILKLPLFWSIVLGIVFALIKISLPNFLFSGFKMLASTASPVALFVIGIFICRCFFKEKISSALFLLFLKMIIFPCFILIFFLIFGYNIKSEYVLISFLQASMPLAVTNFVLAEKYNLNKILAANSIVLSTLFALIEIPLIIYFLT